MYREGYSSSMFVFSIHLLFQFLSSVNCRSAPLAPALYVFGDSLSDSGNNNFLKTEAKVNYNPYGIDFPSGATGRFTNGKTYVDFIAQSMGLPFVPPYLGLSDTVKSKTTLGVNYASGSAGILPETGHALGHTLGLGSQIKFFGETVRKDLPNYFKTSGELSHHLAKSIFIVSIGCNDYINNYLQPAHYDSSTRYSPEQFGLLLVGALKQYLTVLHNLGARKLVVFGLGPIGCMPAIVNNVYPRPNTSCVEDVNKLVLLFNHYFFSMVQELSSSLPGSVLVQGDIYERIYDMNINPSKYGFSRGRTPCCVLGGQGICLPSQTPCQDRNKHFYWDAFHPSEVVNEDVGHDCFSGSSCSPMNIQQLAQK